MTPRQRQLFIDGLSSNRIDHKQHHGGEISILCPKCSPAHDNKRHTLSINTNNDRWNCFRCIGLKGRKNQIGRLLNVLRLDSLASVFDEDEVIVEDDSILKVKNRMLFGNDTNVVESISQIELPDGYRTDWSKTTIGDNLIRYLLNARKVSLESIIKYRLGYIAKGKYAGCVVLPIYMGGKLSFWQVRRVLMAGNAPKYDSPPFGRRKVVFGYDSITTKTVNIVEGIFDAIALGDGTVGLLSKSISEEQIALLGAKDIDYVRVILDGEAWRECQEVAHTIVKRLWTVKQVNAYRLPFGKDPGELGVLALKNPVNVLRLKA